MGIILIAISVIVLSIPAIAMGVERANKESQEREQLIEIQQDIMYAIDKRGKFLDKEIKEWNDNNPNNLIAVVERPPNIPGKGRVSDTN